MRALLIALTALVATAGDLRAQGYVFDHDRTVAVFRYTLGPVQKLGHFNSVTGRIVLDESAPARSRADLVIRTTSLTADAWSEVQLKGPDFFDTANYPEIRFVSRSVREISRGQAEMTGDLTMKAVTRRVRLNVTIRHLEPGTGEPPQRATAARAFVATARLSRSAFNITAMRLLVPDGVDVEVTGILRRAP
jgi:polyisoprenoid-binding protein YceI